MAEPYRVAVAHPDESHPGHATAFYGPAFDANFAQVVAHVRQIPASEVDLVAEAQAAIPQAEAANPGCKCWVVEFKDNADGSGSWEALA